MIQVTLTLNIGLYIFYVFIHWEMNHHGTGPQAGRSDFHRSGATDAELMSAGAGPGRTGFVFVVQHHVSGLARTAAATVFHTGHCGAGLPDMAGARPSAIFTHLGRQDGSGRHPRREWLDDYGLGRDNDSVLVNDSRLASL